MCMFAAACGAGNSRDTARADAISGGSGDAAGQSLNREAPNAPNQKPAFAGQTRAPERKAGVAFVVVTVAEGLEHPWGLAFLPDGRMLVTERPGRLRIVAKNGTLSSPLKGVPAVYASGQGGLLDVVLDPQFAQNRLVYLSFSEPGENGLAGTAVAQPAPPQPPVPVPADQPPVAPPPADPQKPGPDVPMKLDEPKQPPPKDPAKDTKDAKDAKKDEPSAANIAVGKTGGGFFQLGILMQGWFLFERTNGASLSTFRLRRAEVAVKGEILPKRVAYSVMIDPAKVREFATTTVAAYQSFPPARFDLSLSSVHAGRWEDFMCEAQASQQSNVRAAVLVSCSDSSKRTCPP